MPGEEVGELRVLAGEHAGLRGRRSERAVLTLLAAMGGGKAGERYHRKIDRLGYSD